MRRKHCALAVVRRGQKFYKSYNGNNYKRWLSILRKFCFSLSARTVNIWNSLPNGVVNGDVDSVNLCKSRLDRFWTHQDGTDIDIGAKCLRSSCVVD